MDQQQHERERANCELTSWGQRSHSTQHRRTAPHLTTPHRYDGIVPDAPVHSLLRRHQLAAGDNHGSLQQRQRGRGGCEVSLGGGHSAGGWRQHGAVGRDAPNPGAPAHLLQSPGYFAAWLGGRRQGQLGSRIAGRVSIRQHRVSRGRPRAELHLRGDPEIAASAGAGVGGPGRQQHVVPAQHPQCVASHQSQRGGPTSRSGSATATPPRGRACGAGAVRGGVQCASTTTAHLPPLHRLRSGPGRPTTPPPPPPTPQPPPNHTALHQTLKVPTSAPS